jgi:Cell division protein
MLSNITTRTKLLAAVCLVAVLAVVGLVWSQVGSGSADVPVLLVDTNKPIRTKPKDAGGVEVPHTGVLVFDVLADDSGKVEQVINNTPSTSDLAITQSTTLNNDEDPIAKLIEGQSKERKLLQDMAEDGVKDYGQPRVSASMPSGFGVQIGAYRSLERAWAVGSQLVVREEILENMDLQVVEVDLTQKGQFYRVIFGPAEGEDHATKICDYFVGQGRNCIIVGGGA